jgi:hypothetical protein
MREREALAQVAAHGHVLTGSWGQPYPYAYHEVHYCQRCSAYLFRQRHGRGYSYWGIALKQRCMNEEGAGHGDT